MTTLALRPGFDWSRQYGPDDPHTEWAQGRKP
jgi:hypothetical protein